MASTPHQDRRRMSRGGRRLEDFRLQADGAPLTTSDLAAITGMSREFHRRDCAQGVIPEATPARPGWFRIGRGKRRDYRIQWTAARAYLAQLGLLNRN